MDATGEYRLALAFVLLLDAGGIQAHVTREGGMEELDRQVHIGEIQLLRAARDASTHARLVVAYVRRARLGGDWADIDRAGAVLAQGLQLDSQHRDLLGALSP